MNYRFATSKDASILAMLNQQLIRDEGHRNSMDIAQLEERMDGWLMSEYQAVLFEENQTNVGYALFRREADYVYIRQLFVLASHRRKGVGRNAISWLTQNAWPNAPRMRIDVLIHNVDGRAFWRSIGFQDYCLTMESATGRNSVGSNPETMA